MRANRLSSILMRIAFLLFCLVLFSMHILSGTFAKFTVSAKGEGAARTAGFDTSIIPQYPGAADPIQLTDAAGNVSYRFNVDNRGTEVSVKYGIVVEFSDCYDGDYKIADVEDMFTNVKLNGSVYNSCESEDVIGGDIGRLCYYFNDVGILGPGEKSGDYNLTFNISPSFKETTDITLDDGSIYIDYSNRFPIRIYVRAEQVD